MTDFSSMPTGKPIEFLGPRLSVKVCTRRLNMFYEPECVFVSLMAHKAFAFWLDSSRVEIPLSRFSFMGTNTGPLSRVVKYSASTKRLEITQAGSIRFQTESIFEYLDREIARMQCLTDLPFDFNCGFVGYFGYELKGECGSPLVHHSALPDAMFIFADQVIAFDHLEKTTYLVSLVKQGDDKQAEIWFDAIEQQLSELPPLSSPRIAIPETHPILFRLNTSFKHYLDDIQTCKQYLIDGETYEICLTNQLKTATRPEPLALYRNLRRINPAPYSAFLRFDDVAILCSSPERFLRIDSQGMVEAKPIKGTIARGSNPQADRVLQEELRNSGKNRAENIMIVDLLRNDLGIVCDIGSIHVPKLMDVETYATVHQLVSTIRGKLRQNIRAIDCIRVAFPGGSMTGAPKLRTMQIIDALEREARGIYSGAIGFLGLNGTADLNIVIRTIIATPNFLSIGAGGAIVIQSDPEEEFNEMMLKTSALIRAIVLTSCEDFAPEMYRILETRL